LTAIETQGRIAWLNNSPSRRKPCMPPGFGVEFVDIPDHARTAIKMFIESRH
jgi:two-component system, OmpR family, alkaline phosphatase synthesis response regulator PhoP